MIGYEYKELARWAMGYACSKGCSAARVGVRTGASSSFEYRAEQLDRLEQASEHGLAIELYVDDRYGSFSTNQLDRVSLGRFIEAAVAATRFLDKDPLRCLPPVSRCYRGGGADLGTCDGGYGAIGPDVKIELARAAVDEVRGRDPRLVSATSTFHDGESLSYLVASNGFEGEAARTSFTLAAEVSLKGPGDARPEARWHDSAIFFDRLPRVGVAARALERGLSKLGQSKAASGTYPLLLDNRQVGRLLAPLINAMSGGALQQRNSFLVDRLNQPVASGLLSITDAPHAPGAVGARWFDAEGVATQTRAVIEGGVLRSYFIDTYHGAKLGMEPTVQSASVLTFGLGDMDHGQLLRAMGRGIWVTGFNGGNSNSSTGDFSFGVEGFMVEHGEPVRAVNEMNITGNLLDLWGRVAAIGNDPYKGSAWQTPSILFDGVDFSGL